MAGAGNGNQELVGQFPPPKKLYSRRDFLKLGGAGVAATLLAACGIKPTETTTSPSIVERAPYREVENGQTINLVLPGEINRSPVVIQYDQQGNDITPLQIREDKNHQETFLAFTNGGTTSRKMGEVVLPQIYRVVANPNIIDKDGNPCPLHIYPSAVSETGSSDWSVLPQGVETYALPVITCVSDVMGDNHPPMEHNGLPMSNEPVTEFGLGAYIFTLEKMNGKMTAHRGMFLHDLRAVIPAPGSKA